MTIKKYALATILSAISANALAGGPLYIHEKSMKPYKWDTSKGSIPVWTDGGPMVPTKDGGSAPAFTVDYDGTVFLSVDQANKVTAAAVAEWTNVETSTFAMDVRGSIESQIGIADVNETNVDQIYGAENGYGFWVNYDTDGQILEQYFGLPKNAVLGIAFPEWADEETGEITEATALMNGWFVDVSDTEGKKVQGVFTHEFGHAINMSHSQVNGHLTYFSAPWLPLWDAVPNCESASVYGSRFGPRVPLSGIETMFPFINVRTSLGEAQGTVNMRDDAVNISDLYPTPEYKSQYGTIKGKLFTKEGVEYSGINIVVRNLDNWYEDAVSQQSGNLTQGLVGPDGSFEINGLTPGGRYVLYTDEIVAGGYPTRPTPLISYSEYWNDGESSSHATDNACHATEIVLGAGETREIEMRFNGYTDGIQYTPLINAFVLDHSKNGKRALGVTPGGTAFLYEAPQKSFESVLVGNNARITTASALMDKTGTKSAISADFNDSGVGTPALWDLQSTQFTAMEDLSNGTCYISGSQGKNSASLWDMSDDGRTVVGNARRAKSGELECMESERGNSIGVPAVWDHKGSITTLPMDMERYAAWIRADRIAGNGTTITGSTNGLGQVAWINGELRDIYSEFGAWMTSVISNDGKEVVSGLLDGGMVKWNTVTDETTHFGGLAWCEDLPYPLFFGGDACEIYGKDVVHRFVGKYVPATPLDANDDLSMVTARMGSFFQGFTGAIYMEGVGWMTTNEFFARQGVAEAAVLTPDNPFGLSADGSAMFAGVAGQIVTYDVDLSKAFVCDNGSDVELSFPKQVLQAVKDGAEFGRCAHLNDKFE